MPITASTGINRSDQNIPRRRGRPKGSRNRVSPREQSSFTIRNVPPGTQALLSIMADEAGLSQGQILKLAVAEYYASRSPTSNHKNNHRYAEIRRVMGLS